MDQALIRDAVDFVGQRTDLAQEFGGGLLQDPVRVIQDAGLRHPGEYDYGYREHLVYLRPDALRNPGDLRSIAGHELHHAYGTEYDTFELDALSERAANAWELRNAPLMGVHPAYNDYTRRLFEWYK